MQADGVPSPMPRAAARGRPASDAACAGCAQLGLFRALRRAGLDVQGALGCDPGTRSGYDAAPGRWAAVTGARAVLADARAVLASVNYSGSGVGVGAALVVVADARTGASADVEAALAAAGARAHRVDPSDLDSIEAAARAGLEPGGPVLVALAPCVRGAPRSLPFAVAASRCNRCGACLALGCPAISDPGGEAMAIAPSTCTGCGLCAPLCRGRAIVR